MFILKWIGIYIAFQVINTFTFWFLWKFIKATGRTFTGHPQQPPFR